MCVSISRIVVLGAGLVLVITLVTCGGAVVICGSTAGVIFGKVGGVDARDIAVATTIGRAASTLNRTLGTMTTPSPPITASTHSHANGVNRCKKGRRESGGTNSA